MSDLRQYLSVLEEQEQEDILAEYAQHIDMKIQKGQSEEEAIRDFGSVKELAAEILAAYHVDSRHAMSTGRRIWPIVIGRNADRLSEAGAEQAEENLKENLFHRMGRWIRKVCSGTVRGIRNGLCRVGKVCRRIADRCGKPFWRKKEDYGVEEKLTGTVGKDGTDEFAGNAGGMEEFAVGYADGAGSAGARIPEYANSAGGTGNRFAEPAGKDAAGPPVEGYDYEAIGKGRDPRAEKTSRRIRTKERRKGVMGGFFRVLGRSMVRTGRWFLDCCIWGLRLFWNMGWLLVSLLCAGMALLALMGIGATAILICGGYPFVSILIIGLGGMLCFGALAAGAFGMMVQRKEK